MKYIIITGFLLNMIITFPEPATAMNEGRWLQLGCFEEGNPSTKTGE